MVNKTARLEIEKATHNGAKYSFKRYWDVTYTNGDTACMHDTTYQRKIFEQELLNTRTITEDDLDALYELHRMVFEYDRSMEEDV